MPFRGTVREVDQVKLMLHRNPGSDQPLAFSSRSFAREMRLRATQLPVTRYSEVGMCRYMDWIPRRPGPVKRFQTSWPALAKNPVESF
jgi:hypothetical protein